MDKSRKVFQPDTLPQVYESFPCILAIELPSRISLTLPYLSHFTQPPQ